MVFNKMNQDKTSSNSIKQLGKRETALPYKPSTNGSTALMNKARKSQANIRVVVRVRPFNERELQNNFKVVVKVVDDRMLIFDPKEEESPFYYQGVAQKGRDLLKKQNKELQFIFDRVFDGSATNSDIFEGSTKDLISNLLEGYNCSVFAYGATGAGKTHTMLGSINDIGITYRTVAELFTQMDNQSRHCEFNLGVTYLEVYNENVHDLLHKSDPLHLREDNKCGVIVAGLKITKIKNAEELLTLLTKGNKNRTQHPTDANEESSRSHAVFQVYINITNKLDGQVKHVKLSMIDLAGSERGSATGCKGARFKEGANINKSLLALGNCINNLADGIKHIPYRDSKLTRLLKDSLGGNCNTVMIANITPSSYAYEDTYNTLKYANRTKKIKTCVKKNIVSCEMHITGYIKMVEEQKKEINYLKQKLLTYENGVVQASVEPINDKTNEVVKKALPEISNKLLELSDKKRLLNEKMLALESADKILCCRIQYKKAADKRLHNLTYAVDALTSEEQNASGKSRVNKSLDYFKRQRDSLRIQMTTIWKELCTNELEMQKLMKEISSKNLEDQLSDIITIQECEIDKCRMQQQFEHVKKISSLQQCELYSLYKMTKMMSTTLQNYYNTMRGHDTLTEKMKEEFKQLVKLLEGVKNIKWSDSETINYEKDFYNFTCLNTSHLMDPLNNEIPVNLMSDNYEEEQINHDTTNILSRTFNSPNCETENCIKVQDTTITLNENSSTGLILENYNKINIDSPKKRILDDTSHITEKRKKRILLNKTHAFNNKTPLKAKKACSKYTSFSHTTLQGKENNTRRQMSAKNIAILNKLKTGNPKVLPITSKVYNIKSSSPITLKAVRAKERRALLSVHPYQKPNEKHKSTSAPSSSRVPW